MKLKIRKGSTVEVITGSEKGKRGTVLEVKKDTMRVRVEGVRIQTKHTKEEGLKKMEGSIHYSNLKLVEAPVVAKKKAAKKTTTKQKSA
jgi:large subunit ribosomal protein L24